MKLTRKNQSLEFSLEPWEREFFAHCFFALRDDYEAPLEKLSPEEQAHWKGKIAENDEEAKALEAEQHFLEEVRLQWRSERAEKVEQWLKELSQTDENHWHLPLSDADLFLQIINDRRLLLASRHHVGEEDMTRDRFEAPDNPKTRAIGEIDFLAYIQTLCLREIPLD